MTLTRETERPQSSGQDNKIRDERTGCKKLMVYCIAKAWNKDSSVSVIGLRFGKVEIDGQGPERKERVFGLSFIFYTPFLCEVCVDEDVCVSTARHLYIRSPVRFHASFHRFTHPDLFVLPLKSS